MTTNSASYKIWTERKLGSLFSFHRSLSASRAQLGDIGIPYLHYGDIHKTGKTNFDPEKDELPKLDYRENAERYLLKNGDIVFVDASEDRKDVSRFCVIKNKNDIPFLAGLHTVVARPTSSELNINFSEFLFQSDDFKRQVSILANGMKVFGVSKDILSNIVIHYPENMTEQEKIAEILGTWDLAIEKLTALIEQKKLLKKGLMQRLLTGKQRLPGFSDPWKKVKLGELFSKSLLKNKEAKTLPILTNSAAQGIILQDEYFDREIVTKENISNYYCVENGDFIYNPRISKKAPAGPIKRNHFQEKGCISPLYTIFKINQENYASFYEMYFESNLWVYEAYKVANYGVRSDRMNITDEDFFDIKLPYPPLSEQKAIADILSKADEEIDLLTRKLSALKEQKTGLMQQLLTGKIRVKVA